MNLLKNPSIRTSQIKLQIKSILCLLTKFVLQHFVSPFMRCNMTSLHPYLHRMIYEFCDEDNFWFQKHLWLSKKQEKSRLCYYINTKFIFNSVQQSTLNKNYYRTCVIGFQFDYKIMTIILCSVGVVVMGFDSKFLLDPNLHEC